MIKGKGTPVYGGVAIGRAVIYKRPEPAAPYESGDTATEQGRFEKALKSYGEEMNALIDDLDAEAKQIAELHLLLSRDGDWLGQVKALISEGLDAPKAVQRAGEELADELLSIGDDYMSERAADILEMSGRVKNILLGVGKAELPKGNFILIADELSPAETASLPHERILGFVTAGGSLSGHTAILARAYGIPSLINADIPIEEAPVAAIDSITGEWYLDPDKATLDRLNTSKRELENEMEIALEYRQKPAITLKGKRIGVYANIGSPKEAEQAVSEGCEGVGLLRSELHYLSKDVLPTEDELFAAYSSVAKLLGSRPLVIRTLDIGADKSCKAIPLPKEENPALGVRGIRLCFCREDIFKTQLRAIYRAAEYGNIHIMFPMICSAHELERAKKLCEEIRCDLSAKEIPIGAMIETPAAALCAEELARLCDFFSVGTNDLVQYTLAIDRQNGALADYAEPRHPAIIKLLDMTARAAKGAGIWAGVCGELASELALELIEMGYDELSVAPPLIPKLKKKICELDI